MFAADPRLRPTPRARKVSIGIGLAALAVLAAWALAMFDPTLPFAAFVVAHVALGYGIARWWALALALPWAVLPIAGFALCVTTAILLFIGITVARPASRRPGWHPARV